MQLLQDRKQLGIWFVYGLSMAPVWLPVLFQKTPLAGCVLQIP
jgi:hypothetical protein